jgi:hypothetical protein
VPLVEPSDMVSVAPVARESSATRLMASELNARLAGVGGGVDSLPQDSVTRMAAVATRKRAQQRIGVWSR